MFYAARVQLVELVIKPALARGAWVISDRHELSSQAYQGGGRGINHKLLKTLREELLGDLSPDITIYLDVHPTIGIKRTKGRHKLDRIEMESLDFFIRTRETYQKLAASDSSIVTIDASQPQHKVNANISDIIKKFFLHSKE